MSRAQLTSTVEQSSGGAVAPFLAGKNKIINGDFLIWQRGTSFTVAANAGAYTADRWFSNRDGSGATVTISQQSFTAGSAPVAGYEGTYFLRFNQSVAGSGQTYGFVEQRLEDVRIFAGQTITISFWMKADTNRSINGGVTQYFGSGGSSSVVTTFSSQSVTTSWARYSATITIPSVSGKTIGSGSFLEVFFNTPQNTTSTIDLWGIQLEAGSVATPFTTCSNTLQGELALCQRYCFKTGGKNSAANDPVGVGQASSSTTGVYTIFFPTEMRTTPSLALGSNTASNYAVTNGSDSSINCSALPTLNIVSPNVGRVVATVASGLTTGQGSIIYSASSANGYFLFTAEL